jgi:hypothetical protein
MTHSGSETPFAWSVGCGSPALGYLAGVPMHRLFRELDAVVEAFTIGWPRVRELFGERVTIGPPVWAPTGYGHINALGVELIFPEDSEVGREAIHDSLDDGIAAMRCLEDVDFTTCGLFPFYLDLWRQIKRAFPDEEVPFRGFSSEGPITTAYLLRGEGFFTDLYDDPQNTGEYLALIADSAAKFVRVLRQINNQPDAGCGMADDVSAMIAPQLWPTLVLPCMHRYYEAATDSDERSAHIEDLTQAHLPYLNQLRLKNFDPSVSPRLTPAIMRDHATMAFGWRLNAMQVRDFTVAQVRQFVIDAVADGAETVHSHIEQGMCNEAGAAKIAIFMDTAEQVKQLLAGGCSRDRLRDELGAS